MNRTLAAFCQEGKTYRLVTRANNIFANSMAFLGTMKAQANAISVALKQPGTLDVVHCYIPGRC